MPNFPPPGSLTVCEIRRELVVADSISDSHAKDAYGNLLGTVFSPIPFEPNGLLVNTERLPDDGNSDVLPSSDGLGGVKGSLSKCLSAITGITRKPVKLQSKISVHAISWHQHKQILAFISGPNQVLVHDFDDLDCRDPCTLSSESQRGVQMLDWRPNGGRTLAVACKGGICIWSASYPGNSASLRSGSASFLVTPARGSGIRWAMVDFLRTLNGETVTSLSWSPNGRYPLDFWFASNLTYVFIICLIVIHLSVFLSVLKLLLGLKSLHLNRDNGASMSEHHCEWNQIFDLLAWFSWDFLWYSFINKRLRGNIGPVVWVSSQDLTDHGLRIRALEFNSKAAFV